MDKKRFGAITIVIIVAAILVVGGIIWYHKTYMGNTSLPQPSAATGSVQSMSQIPTSTVSAALSTSSVATPAGWETYTNSQYGFEIQFPSSWTFSQETSSPRYFEFMSDSSSDAIEIEPVDACEYGDAIGSPTSTVIIFGGAHAVEAEWEDIKEIKILDSEKGWSPDNCIVLGKRDILGIKESEQVLSTFRFIQ
jgi:hypothetical protein